MKIVNIVNIPNYPNYTIYDKDNEDLCINIDYTNIQDVTFGVYYNPKNDKIKDILKDISNNL